MRERPTERMEAGRIRTGPYESDRSSGCNGAFRLEGPHMAIVVIASDGSDPITNGWEHVSVSGRRTPNWEEMCFVKDAFWMPEEIVMQLHPPASLYINIHPHCLHMWGHRDKIIPMPPQILVGPKNLDVLL